MKVSVYDSRVGDSVEVQLLWSGEGWYADYCLTDNFSMIRRIGTSYLKHPAAVQEVPVKWCQTPDQALGIYKDGVTSIREIIMHDERFEINLSNATPFSKTWNVLYKGEVLGCVRYELTRKGLATYAYLVATPNVSFDTEVAGERTTFYFGNGNAIIVTSTKITKVTSYGTEVVVCF